MGFSGYECEWGSMGRDPVIGRVWSGAADRGSQWGHLKGEDKQKAVAAGSRDRVVQPDLEDGRGHPAGRRVLRKIKARVTRGTDRLDRRSGRNGWRTRPEHGDEHPLLQYGLPTSLEQRGVLHN